MFQKNKKTRQDSEYNRIKPCGLQHLIVDPDVIFHIIWMPNNLPVSRASLPLCLHLYSFNKLCKLVDWALGESKLAFWFRFAVEIIGLLVFLSG